MAKRLVSKLDIFKITDTTWPHAGQISEFNCTLLYTYIAIGNIYTNDPYTCELKTSLEGRASNLRALFLFSKKKTAARVGMTQYHQGRGSVTQNGNLNTKQCKRTICYRLSSKGIGFFAFSSVEILKTDKKCHTREHSPYC